MHTEQSLLEALESDPNSIEFTDVMNVIESAYAYTPTGFTCGGAVSAAGSNEGSCKILAFAKKRGLNEQQTLQLFGDFYRQDVLQNPDGDDHANIRNFMKVGWSGVSFESEPLA